MAAIFDSLKGKRVLITGSSRGIGRALALGFAENGADVAIHGVSCGSAMLETVELASAFGGKVITVLGDLSDPNVPEKMINEVIEKLGGIDVLICNASIQIRRPWLDISDEDMHTQINTNFISCIKLIQKSVPNMLSNGWGRVITIGSVQQDKPHPDMLVYSAIKSGILNVVQSLAIQLADKNITVNNVPVGTIYTDRNVDALKDDEYHKKVKNDIPMKRIGNPEDCVDAVLMLASEGGRYITGENLHIDGGKFI